MNRISALGVVLLGAIFSVSAFGKGKAELVLSAQTAKPGETILAGIHIRLDPGWHTYWQYPGDSGQAATIDWVLPNGVKAGEIQWPVPEKANTEGLITYGYEDEVLLLVPLQLSGTLSKDQITLKATVRWLECKTSCIPVSGKVEGKLSVGDEIVPSPENGLIQQWRTRLPKTGPVSASVTWAGPTETNSRPFTIRWKNEDPAKADFFPVADKNYEISNETKRVVEGSEAVLNKTLTKTEGNWPGEIGGLLVIASIDKSKPPTGYEVKLTLPPMGAGTTESSVAVPTVQSNLPQISRPSLLGMLGLAFLGGLILNIMPCVLPVIALKILGFVSQSHDQPGRIRQMGFIYGAGVLVSFLILAGIVIAVKQAGGSATWGMQFQNPEFLVVLTTLVTLVALNLFGLFEINLGGKALNAAGQLASKEGISGAFFNGVLTTALATPCSAPALGIALGFAFAQPPSIIILMFLTVGLGLATPYVILSCQPAWLKFLPKPGAWMEKFKIAMGFPMLATAVWLFSLATPHFNRHAPFWFGVFLVLIALAAWIWGEFVQRGSKRQTLSIVISVALVALGYFGILERELSWRVRNRPAESAGLPPRVPGGIPWEWWSAQAVAKLRSEGRPVFVDFTADWCLICQGNKRSSIEIPSVRKKLAEINAGTLIGDFTDQSPVIAAELLRFERGAVPLVLVYPADSNAPPIVLPELLTPSIVLDALAKAARTKNAAKPSEQTARN